MLKAPKTPEELDSGLSGFYGTENYHCLNLIHKVSGLVCTDGVKWLADNAGDNGCHWLIDIIASYQPVFRHDKMLRHIQFWTLTVNADKSAVLICEKDEGKLAVTKEIEYTDFQLPEIKIWVEEGECGGRPVMVAMLPSER